MKIWTANSSSIQLRAITVYDDISKSLAVSYVSLTWRTVFRLNVLKNSFTCLNVQFNSFWGTWKIWITLSTLLLPIGLANARDSSTSVRILFSRNRKCCCFICTCYCLITCTLEVHWSLCTVDQDEDEVDHDWMLESISSAKEWSVYGTVCQLMQKQFGKRVVFAADKFT